MEKTVTRLLQRLKKLREACGMTQEGFAEQAGISYKYYQAVEAGRKQDLRLSTLERLAAAFGIEVWQLLAPAEPEVKLSRKKASQPPHYTRKDAAKVKVPKSGTKHSS